MTQRTTGGATDGLAELERHSMRTARVAQRLAGGVLVLALGAFWSMRPEPSVTAEAPVDDPALASNPTPDGAIEAPAPTDRTTTGGAAPPPSATTGSASPGGMVLVPSGVFTMGRVEGGDDERPAHEVELSAFWIDATEVTVSAYLECVGQGPCRPPAARCAWPGPERPLNPVACVDWGQAQSYCRWVGKRLPTEAEWEKAARGSDGREYPWGDDPPTCTRSAFNDRGDDPAAVKGCGRSGSWPVGSFPPGASPFGVADMAGNVWEWVADRYAPNYYAESPRKDPTGPETGDMRVRRGGSWKSLPVYLPSGVRGRMDPAERNEIVGFRCAESP